MKKLVLPMLALVLSGSVAYGQENDNNSNAQHEYVVNHQVPEKEYANTNGKVEEGPQARNHLILNNISVNASHGFWTLPFPTGSIAHGNSLNIWYRNDTNYDTRVTVDIVNNNGTFTRVTQFTVAGNSQFTRQIRMMVVDFNTNMRINVENMEGRPVQGVTSIRQINQ